MSLVYTKAAWGQENNDERILNYSLRYPLYKNVKYSKAAGDSIFGEVESRVLLRLSVAYKPRPRDNNKWRSNSYFQIRQYNMGIPGSKYKRDLATSKYELGKQS